MKQEKSFKRFATETISWLNCLNKTRTAETYQSALNSFMQFRNDADVPINRIDADMMMIYESWLKERNVSKNTVSFYMRILRAIYNRAVEKGLTKQNRPFKHVYTGIGKTVKRAIPIEAIRNIKSFDLSKQPSLELARDLFLFSFYTRGMAFVDMAYLKKNDLKNNCLVYRRHKTGQLLSIGWESCMQDIVDKHSDKSSPYLLPIIRKDGNERNQYRNAQHLVNSHLKKISELVSLTEPITMYVARHSWASSALKKDIPLSIISEGMGHNSESTTRIYLASIENSLIDKANRIIIDSL